MIPAQEHGRAVDTSNAKRQAELVEKINQAGVYQEFIEYLQIMRFPERAFSERIEKSRKERVYYAAV